MTVVIQHDFLSTLDKGVTWILGWSTVIHSQPSNSIFKTSILVNTRFSELHIILRSALHDCYSLCVVNTRAAGVIVIVLVWRGNCGKIKLKECHFKETLRMRKLRGSIDYPSHATGREGN